MKYHSNHLFLEKKGIIYLLFYYYYQKLKDQVCDFLRYTLLLNFYR